MGWFRLWKRRQEAGGPLDRVIMALSDSDHWTVRDLLSNCINIGQTGSGKSSGWVQNVIAGAARQKLALFFNCAKKEDAAFYGRLAAGAGYQVCYVSDWPLDVLMYEWGQVGSTKVICELLLPAIELANKQVGGGGGGDESGFFVPQTLLRFEMAADLLVLAGEPVTFPAIKAVLEGAPKTAAQAQSPEWRKGSYCGQLLAFVAQGHPETPDEAITQAHVVEFFNVSIPNLSARTRSILEAIQTQVLLIFCRPPVRNVLASGEVSLTPDEWAREGLAVVCDFGTLVAPENPTVNGTLRYLYQRALFRRDTRKSNRPCLIVHDEVQTSLVSTDIQVLSVNRSHLFGHLLATQSLPVLKSCFSENRGEAFAAALLSNCVTTVWNATRCPVTLGYVQESVGRQLMTFDSGGATVDEHGVRPNVGRSEHFETPIEGLLQSLASGGPRNNRIVQALITQTGRTFNHSGQPFLLTEFQQREV
ncbi:MAG: type IV secretory system conjugative DNA transfer family protein [Gemmataceae bacterium]|nr:type IV secretory system conjugative DNA transfer family protein [Gemmataceae bacterium]